MSSAPDAHDAPAGSAHARHGHGDAHGTPDAHHQFDGEPVTALPADEPRTPGWLPLLGLALFVSAGVYFLVTGDHPESAAPKLTPMDLPAPAAPPVTQAAQPAAQPGADGLQKMSPQQIAELRKKLEDARAKGAPPSNQGQARP